MRQVVVRIRGEEDWEEIKALKREDLIKKFKNQANEATGSIVAGYTKPSKEVVLITATVEQREALEAMGEWAQVGCGSAEVRRQTFPIAVHGIQRATACMKVSGWLVFPYIPPKECSTCIEGKARARTECTVCSEASRPDETRSSNP